MALILAGIELQGATGAAPYDEYVLQSGRLLSYFQGDAAKYHPTIPVEFDEYELKWHSYARTTTHAALILGTASSHTPGPLVGNRYIEIFRKAYDNVRWESVFFSDQLTTSLFGDIAMSGDATTVIASTGDALYTYDYNNVSDDWEERLPITWVSLGFTEPPGQILLNNDGSLAIFQQTQSGAVPYETSSLERSGTGWVNRQLVGSTPPGAFSVIYPSTNGENIALINSSNLFYVGFHYNTSSGLWEDGQQFTSVPATVWSDAPVVRIDDTGDVLASFDGRFLTITNHSEVINAGPVYVSDIQTVLGVSDGTAITVSDDFTKIIVWQSEIVQIFEYNGDYLDPTLDLLSYYDVAISNSLYLTTPTPLECNADGTILISPWVDSTFQLDISIPNPTNDGTGPGTFLGLTDTAGTYVGAAGYVATVNATEDGLIFLESQGGGGGGLDAVVDDPSPQLGGGLDVNGFAIYSAPGSGEDINVLPDSGTFVVVGTGAGVITSDVGEDLQFVGGSGTVVIGDDTLIDSLITTDSGVNLVIDPAANLILKGLIWPAADGTNGQAIITDGLGNLSWGAGGGGIDAVVEDLTPQLGGDLDVNDFSIISAAASGQDVIIAPDTGTLSIVGPATGVATIESGVTEDLQLIAGSGDVLIGTPGATGVITSDVGEDLQLIGASGTTIIGEAGTTAIITTDTAQDLSLEPDANLILKGQTWPAADGTASQILSTDGAGTLTWTAATAAAPVDSVAGKTGVVTLVKADITDFVEADYATAAQGTTADSATQPADNISTLTNDAAYITLGDIPADAVTSVAGKTGVVTLVKADITDFVEGDYATAAQGATADTALQDITAESIGDLSDVDITTVAPATASTLAWDGSQYLPEVDSGWTVPTWATGWSANADVTQQNGYRKIGNVVHIAINADSVGVAASSLIFTLPAGYIPTLGYTTTAVDQLASNVAYPITVDNAGAVTAHNLTATAGTKFYITFII